MLPQTVGALGSEGSRICRLVSLRWKGDWLCGVHIQVDWDQILTLGRESWLGYQPHLCMSVWRGVVVGGGSGE